MSNQLKRIKLHGKHRYPNQNVPWLNINGFWLERAGFGIGQVIEIEVENRQLTIKAV